MVEMKYIIIIYSVDTCVPTYFKLIELRKLDFEINF